MSLDRLIKKKSAAQKAATKDRRENALDLSQVVAQLEARSGKKMHPDRKEMDRILSLAFVDMMTVEEADEFSRGILLASAYENDFRLFSEQASAVAAYLTENGGFFPIGVGWGKTLTSLMVAERAWKKGIKKMAIMLEPSCLSQLVKTDIPMGRRVTNISVPFIVLGGKQPKERKLYYESGRKGCYIIPYSLLSTRDTMDMLEAIDPDLVIADECHNLKDRKTARTKRWMAMMNYRERELVAMSGTITSKSIEDYRHLIDLALKDGSPLPRSGAMAHGWSRVLDSGSVITDQHQAGPLEPLVSWANERRIEQRRAEPDLAKRDAIQHLRLTVSDLREAFTNRMQSAPGVVSSPDSEIKASVSIEGRNEKGIPWADEGKFWESREGWANLDGHMRKVKDEWQTPNGDEIEHAIHTFKWMVELGSGFYNELVWPLPDWVMDHHGVTEVGARCAIADAQQAHALQQCYHKELRNFFEVSPPGLDTPMVVALVINQRPQDVPAELVVKYHMWKDAENAARSNSGFLVERLSNAVRVCDFKIQRAVTWAAHAMKNYGSAIIWVHNREIGKWTVDALSAAKIPVVACPAGANEAILDLFNPENGTANAVAVASIRSHGTGKNLQRAGAQLFLQWPRDAKQAEQALGRVHRNGVEHFADHVTVTTMNVLPYDHVLFGACLVDAVYQHQTGSRRKMVYATYDPMPKIFSPEFLKARGASTKSLTPRQLEMMEDKFGEDWSSQI